MGVLICVILAASLAADAEKPDTISDRDFILNVTSSVHKAQQTNSDIKLLGVGTAMLLDSQRPSKIGCGIGNTNPQPGQCSDAFPVYPEPVALDKLIENERLQRPAETCSKPTVWIAWQDTSGSIRVVFNGRMGAYEKSTLYQVDESGRWSAGTQYYVVVRTGGKEFVDAVNIGAANITEVTLGTGSAEELQQRLNILLRLGIIAEYKDLSEAFAIWQGIPAELTAEQQKPVEEFDRQIADATHKETDELNEFVSRFPWVSPPLTVQDKFFLTNRLGKMVADAAMAADMSQ